MPVLAAWLGNLFASVVAFFATFLTQRLAIIAAVILAAAALTTAFVGAMQALEVGISAAVPSWITTAWGWFVPDNLDECGGAIFTAHVIRWVYSWNIRVIQWKLV